MQWSEVTKAPSLKMLRQFAGLSLVVFGGLAAWRLWHGQDGWLTYVLGILAIGIGVTGLIAPAVIRPIYTGWMIVAFPIGWTITQLVLVVLYFGLFTPIAFIFRLMGRDALSIGRQERPSYWAPKRASSSTADYLREY